jgi:hypothetical protein
MIKTDAPERDLSVKGLSDEKNTDSYFDTSDIVVVFHKQIRIFS